MSQLQLHICSEQDRERWDGFVAGHPECTNYHRWRWRHVFQDVFGWPATYLLAEENGQVRGILPLITQKCLLRSYLSSMPHLNGGGVAAENPEAAQILLEAAVRCAQERKATYLELRHAVEHAFPLIPREDKVAAVLRIEPDSELRLRQLDKKTRNLVRKSLSFGMTSEIGGSALLDEFYEVYRTNMRDLGSPSYSRAFFANILSHFPEDTRICLARLNQETIAGAFLLGFRNTLEVAWASSYRKFLNLKPNMFLYWNILEFGGAHGYECLDFGRSSKHSGTFDFKRQWGAVARDLHWGYWLNDRARLPSNRQGGMQVVSRVWQKLPVALTNVLGPRLVSHIPGV
jgi:FemAB-related protein (PEP-CTERM system-associated)